MNTKKLALRIGVIQSGRLIEEFVVHDDKPVTIGTNINNNVVVSDKSFPSKYKLFVPKDGCYSIEVNEIMTIELKDGEDLKKYSNSKQSIKLKNTQKGKVIIGKTIVLFQFIEAPEQLVIPKKIPPQFRKNFLDEIDWRFFFPLLASFMIHMSGSVVLYFSDLETAAVSFNQLPDRFREVVIEQPKKEVVVAEVKKEGEGDEVGKGKEDENKKENKTVEKDVTKVDKSGLGKEERKEVAKASIGQKSKLISDLRKISAGGNGFGSITGGGSGDGGSVTSLSSLGLDSGSGNSGYGDGGNGGGLDIRGGGSGGGGGTGISRTNVGGDGPATVKTSEVTGNEKRDLKTQEVKKVAIQGKTKMDAVTVDKGIDETSATNALKKANKQMNGCYQEEAKKNNSFKGKIKIMVTIGADGKPINIEFLEVTMNDATLSQSMLKCIEKKMKRVEFPIPEKPPVSVKFTAAFSPGE